MSLPADVAAGLARLDPSPRALRAFALTVGGALLLLAGWLAWGGGAPAASLPAGAGLLLAAAGLLFPARLRLLHRGWMALALALGWVVSRLVLTALFLLVVTPLGLAARLSGRRFLELRPDRRARTYWIPRPPDRRDDFTKMY